MLTFFFVVPYVSFNAENNGANNCAKLTVH